MQNRSVNERLLNAGAAGHSYKNEQILDGVYSVTDDDPLLVMNAEQYKTYDKRSTRQNEPSTRGQAKKQSKRRKHRGKQEIQPISSSSNFNASVYQVDSIMVNPDYSSQHAAKIELEKFSKNNSHAKYTKNLQFREKLPKKSYREKSMPAKIHETSHNVPIMTGSSDQDGVSQRQTTSVEQYNSYLNNPTQNSVNIPEPDSMATSTQDYNFGLKGNKMGMRTSSLSSSNITLISETTSSNELVGWSYQKTRDGKLYNMTQGKCEKFMQFEEL